MTRLLSKQDWLYRETFGLKEIAQAYTDQTKTLLRSDANTFPKRESNRRQLRARRRRDEGVWLRVRILNSAVFISAPQFSQSDFFVARCGPGQFQQACGSTEA